MKGSTETALRTATSTLERAVRMVELVEELEEGSVPHLVLEDLARARRELVTHAREHGYLGDGEARNLAEVRQRL